MVTYAWENSGESQNTLLENKTLVSIEAFLKLLPRNYQGYMLHIFMLA